MAFCENCGFKLDEGALFCGNCGTANKAAQNHAVQENVVRQSEYGKFHTYLKGKKKRIVILIGIVVVFCVVSFWGSDSRKYINIVKQGCNDYYDQITTGEASELFLGGVKWKYNTSTKLVEVTGECLYGGIPVKAKMEYYVYDNKAFELKSVSLDNGYGAEFLSEREKISFVSDLYESAYLEKGLEPPANVGDALDGLDILTDLFSY